MLEKHIFNTEKTDYQNQSSLFFGQQGGLFDTVNKNFPKIWEIYKNMKSLDWDELEFDFKTCNVEFKTKPTSISQRMIHTLGWQWEADSVAARTGFSVMAPFISSPELQACWLRVQENEVLHSATYSEIVRYSFDDPNKVLSEVLKVKDSLMRLDTLSKVMADCYQVSHQYALGQIPADQRTYNHAYLFVVCMLLLERIQFMASFAVTFAIGETGSFMPIAKAVQKICQDEFEVHVAMDKEILTIEHRNEMGRRARKETLPIVRKLIQEVIKSEFAWIDFMKMDQDPLVGLNGDLLRQWVLHSAGDVYDFLEIKPADSEWVIPTKNPIGYMANWMDISKTQSSPQEQQKGDYKVNIITRVDEKETYTVDF